MHHYGMGGQTLLVQQERDHFTFSIFTTQCALEGSASKELEQLRKSTNETWDKAKVRMDKAIEDLIFGLYERSKAKAKENGKDKVT